MWAAYEGAVYVLIVSQHARQHEHNEMQLTPPSVAPPRQGRGRRRSPEDTREWHSLASGGRREASPPERFPRRPLSPSGPPGFASPFLPHLFSTESRSEYSLSPLRASCGWREPRYLFIYLISPNLAESLSEKKQKKREENTASVDGISRTDVTIRSPWRRAIGPGINRTGQSARAPLWTRLEVDPSASEPRRKLHPLRGCLPPLSRIPRRLFCLFETGFGDNGSPVVDNYF